MTDPIRINARLSGDDARAFRELEALAGSATLVIREAVREYHRQRLPAKRSARDIFAGSGFIGSIRGAGTEGSGRDSVRQAMDAVLRRKFPDAGLASTPPRKPPRAPSRPARPRKAP